MKNLFLLGPLAGTILAASALADDSHRHDHESAGHAGARRTQTTNALASSAAITHSASATNQLVLPPLPNGVAELKFADFFKPIGPRGLEYTDKVRALAGKKVRLLAYMARQSEPQPGMFLLAPVPLRLNEHEYGLAEDMPATLVHAFPTTETTAIVPFTPGLLLLTGTLAIGPRQEVDGRISSVRLELDPPPVAKEAAARKFSSPSQTENDRPSARQHPGGTGAVTPQNINNSSHEKGTSP
ncbi:MAG TPA: hypothetical protein VK846_00490 [Candidatus Limnocylindria bacterium]|nr:hypothetical protein [Candidatus Limnocylindria bacterium]